MEPEARDFYAFATNADLTQVGFVRNGQKGASLDSCLLLTVLWPAWEWGPCRLQKSSRNDVAMYWWCLMPRQSQVPGLGRAGRVR
jgi:hypothetical protein